MFVRTTRKSATNDTEPIEAKEKSTKNKQAARPNEVSGHAELIRPLHPVLQKVHIEHQILQQAAVAGGGLAHKL